MNLSTVLRPKDAEGRATRGVVFLFVLLSVVFANACYQEAFADEQPFVIKHPWKGTQYTDTTILVTEPGDTVEPGIHLTSPSTIYFDATPFSELAWWEVILGDTGSTAPEDQGTTLTVAGGSGIATAVTPLTVTINNTSNIFSTVELDSGTLNASGLTDTLGINGGTGISTAVGGGVVVITNTAPNVDQDVYETVTGDTGSTTADSPTDSLAIVGGTGVSTAVTADTVTINNTAVSIGEIVTDGGTYVVPTLDDSVNFVGGTGIDTDFTGDTMTWTNTAEFFKTVTADTGSIAAGAFDDTAIVTGGTGISTSGSGKTLTITNTAPNVVQDLWATIEGDSGSATANSPTDLFQIAGTDPIDTAVSGDVLTVEIDTAKDFTSTGTWTIANLIASTELSLNSTGSSAFFYILESSNNRVRAGYNSSGGFVQGYDSSGNSMFLLRGYASGGGEQAVFSAGDVQVDHDLIVDGELEGSRHTYQFGNPNLASSSQYMMANGVQLSSTRGEVMPRSGSIVGIAHSTNVTAKVANSNAIASARVNGSIVFSDTIFVNSTGVKSGYATQARDIDKFSAGDLLAPSYGMVTLLNTWEDTIITIEVVFDN